MASSRSLRRQVEAGNLVCLIVLVFVVKPSFWVVFGFFMWSMALERIVDSAVSAAVEEYKEKSEEERERRAARRRLRREAAAAAAAAEESSDSSTWPSIDADDLLGLEAGYGPGFRSSSNSDSKEETSSLPAYDRVVVSPADPLLPETESE